MDTSTQDISVYNECRRSVFDGDEDNVFQCVSLRLEEILAKSEFGLDDGNLLHTNNPHFGLVVVLSGSLVFFMQTGFAMVCAGCVRKKNAQNTMLKNLLDACGSAIAFFCFGYGIAFGESEAMSMSTTNRNFMLVGNGNFFGSGDIDPATWFFQYAFSAAAVTIVAGTLAERCKMIAYLFYSMLLAGFVYPVVAHSIWSNYGFLSPFNTKPLLGIGMVDFAGGGVVHVTGGITALFAASILGSRRGRFYDVDSGKPLETPNPITGHSVQLQMFGTLCLWFGWYGFNPGSALFLPEPKYRSEIAALAAVNTSLSAAGGGLSAMFTKLFMGGRDAHGCFTSFDLIATMNGCLSGLVAITAACGTVENWASLIIGIVAGWIYVWGSQLLVKYRIDDAVDAIPVHMFNGIWGVLAAGLFSSPIPMKKVYNTVTHVGWFYSIGRGSPREGNLLACQIVGILFICFWTLFIMLPFFIWLNYMGWFRTESVTELVGLDMFYHGDLTHRAIAASPIAGKKQTLRDKEDEELIPQYLETFVMRKDSKQSNSSKVR